MDKTGRIKFYYFIFIIAILSIISTGCGGEKDDAAVAQKLIPFSLGIGYIDDVQFAPIYVAIEKGFYRDEGIELELQNGFSVDVFALLYSGKLDAGLTDADQLILSSEQDGRLTSFFQYYKDYPVAIAARSENITEPADFIGKTIGTPDLSGSSYIGLLTFLDHFGITDQVSVEKIGYNQITALIDNQVAGAVVFLNNEPNKLAGMGIRLSQWNVRDFSPLVGAAIIAPSAALDDELDKYRKFARATRRAMAFTVANQDEAVSIAGKYVTISDDNLAFIKEVLSKTCQLFGESDSYGLVDPYRYLRTLEILQRLNIIEKNISVDQIVNYDVFQ